MGVTKGKIKGTWKLDFHRANQKRVERTFSSKAKALRVWRELEERALAGLFGWPSESKVTVKKIVDLVVQDYIDNARSSLRTAREHCAFWTNLAGSQSTDAVTGERLKEWARDWLAGGLSAGRVNRRMSFLMRAYKLGMTSDPPLIDKRPPWKDLEESPPRSGTWSWEDFLRVRAALPPHARVPVSIEYWCGMRSGETHKIEWAQVRFDHDERRVYLHLPSTNTKTKEQRVVVQKGDLYEVLAAWRDETKHSFPKCEYVCHYRGKRLGDMKTAWKTACVKIGLGRWDNPDGAEVGNRLYRGPLIHDFRRTGVSNMEDCGISRKIAMSISGHKTDNCYRRYHIVKQEALEEAADKLARAHEAKHNRPVKDGGSMSNHDE